MSFCLNVDELYERFVRGLPAELQPCAVRLAHELQLAPSQEVRWSQVFSHKVTLGAPALFAEGMEVRGELVERACYAHLLAVVAAFCMDRLIDQQVKTTMERMALLQHLKGASGEALQRLATPAEARALNEACWEQAQRASAAERRLLGDEGGVSFHDYIRLSLAKQRAAYPPSLLLARAAGWGEERRQVLESCLDNITLALQALDDTLDWEDDVERGGVAWAWALARGMGGGPRGAAAGAKGRRDQVHESGVLVRLIQLARARFGVARSQAQALGAHELGRWAGEQEAQAGELAILEDSYPGYLQRRHALRAWVRGVIND